MLALLSYTLLVVGDGSLKAQFVQVGALGVCARSPAKTCNTTTHISDDITHAERREFVYCCAVCAVCTHAFVARQRARFVMVKFVYGGGIQMYKDRCVVVVV